MTLTPLKKLSAVSLTPVNIFSAVSLTPAISLGLLVISDRYQRHRGKMLSPVSLTPAINCSPVSTTPPAINCIDDRVLLLLQNYLRPLKSATAADIVIGHCCKTISGRRSRPRPPILSLDTAMKTRKGTSHTLIRGPGGRQNYFKPKWHYLVLAASLKKISATHVIKLGFAPKAYPPGQHRKTSTVND